MQSWRARVVCLAGTTALLSGCAVTPAGTATSSAPAAPPVVSSTSTTTSSSPSTSPSPSTTTATKQAKAPAKTAEAYSVTSLSSAQRKQNGKLELDANTVEHLLAEIQHPALQEVLVSTMLDIVNADRRLTSSEAGLIAQALKQWQLDILEISGRHGSELPARPRPTH